MREQLERYQVWLYLVAILAGMAIGWGSPEQTRDWELLPWPALGALLYTTFTQVPLIHLTSAFRDRRFLAALLTGNFLRSHHGRTYPFAGPAHFVARLYLALHGQYRH